MTAPGKPRRTPVAAARQATRAAARLGPIGTDEATVDQVIVFVHGQACGTTGKTHDPLCNTLRLLAEDWQQLATRSKGHLPLFSEVVATALPDDSEVSA